MIRATLGEFTRDSELLTVDVLDLCDEARLTISNVGEALFNMQAYIGNPVANTQYFVPFKDSVSEQLGVDEACGPIVYHVGWSSDAVTPPWIELQDTTITVNPRFANEKSQGAHSLKVYTYMERYPNVVYNE